MRHSATCNLYFPVGRPEIAPHVCEDEIGSFEVPPTSELRAGPRRSSSGKGSGGAAKVIWADEDDR